jgi:hypothetical protein
MANDTDTILAKEAAQYWLDFHHFQARTILERIIYLLQHSSNEKGLPVALANMYRELSENSEKILASGKALAPYQSPKLEAVAVKSEVKHQFAIHVPARVKDVNEWLKGVPKEFGHP